MSKNAVIKYGTVSVRAAKKLKNLTDLMHLYANMAFTAGFPESHAIEQAANAIKEQYIQNILSAPTPLEHI